MFHVSSCTDICKDSSDDDYSDADSSHTEGYAVVDVAIEYDVPDDSESDDTSSGSSGTDVSVQKVFPSRRVNN